LADLSARQSRVQRLGEIPRAHLFDGDKSLAKSGEDSPHSKATMSLSRGKTQEWLIDCRARKSPGPWLRDGDGIEAPDK